MELLQTYGSFIIPAAACIVLLVALTTARSKASKGAIGVAILTILILSATTYVQGVWSERWLRREATVEQKELAERMDRLPTVIGDWESVDAPASVREMEAARAVGYYQRRFFNRQGKGEPVTVTVLCGHPRDMTSHTPERCLAASGYEEAADFEKYVVEFVSDSGKRAAEFYSNLFRRGASVEGGPQNMRFFWSFSPDGVWVSPNAPKFALSSYPAVVKIYAYTEVPKDSAGRIQDSSAKDFLKEFLPVVNATLFAAPASAGSDDKAPSGDKSPSSSNAPNAG